MIHFDDGDVEDNVEWERIEPLNESSKEVQEYINHDSEAEKELIEAFEVFDDNNTGTIPAREYMRILTESGDDPIPVDEVMDQFNELGIQLDSQIDYRELAKYLVGSQMMENAEAVKPEVVIRDAEIVNGKLKGYAYAHPKLGETWINSSSIEGITFDERATSRVETRNTIYVVGPTGWLKKPENHPFNQPTFNTGQQVKVEWNGSWWDAIIREIRGDNSDGNLFLIHYVGFDSSWDEWIDISRIKNA